MTKRHEMVRTFVDRALEELTRLNNHRHLHVSFKVQIQALWVDVRLLKMFLGCLITWDPDKDVIALDFNLESMVSSIESIWDNSGEDLYAAGHLARVKGEFKDWNMVASKLEETMQQCKQEINKYCAHLFSCSLECQSFPSNQKLEFLDEILNNLKHLDLPVENQIETLKEKLLLLRNLIDFADRRCPNGKDLSDFMIHVHTWANQAACLTCLYWVNEVEVEEIGNRLNVYLTDLLQKVNPCTPEFTRMCFAVMKSTKSSRADTILLGRFVSNFVDFLLQNLAVALEDEFEILFEGLIFLISFLVDPPKNSVDDYALTLARSQTDDVLDEASRLICSFSETKEDLGRDRTNLLDLVRKIHNIRVQIEKHYVQIPNFSFPRTNGPGYVEHLLGNIEDLTKTMNCNPNIASFAKHKILRVKEELLSLRQSIHVIWELLNEHKELKDLLAKMIHVAYKAELAVNSSFTVDHPIWYHLACLSSVLKETKDVQDEFVKFEANRTYGTVGAAPKNPAVYMPPVSGLDEIVVGFNDEERLLMDRITRGTTKLDIVPIVGMGGLGKTTLARKLYNALSVRLHFHVRAFCNVGQEHYSSGNILLEILGGLTVIDDGVRALTTDDLAHKLKRCLLGRRYLIIMDDIWDVTAWEGVKSSFPDDKNGSRVVFTTRINSVALQAKSDCNPHELRRFTIDESWELLQAKVFHEDPCPPDLREVGMFIAEKCNGLPTAVVVIAGLLASLPTGQSSWNRIADDLNSYASSEGCRDTLEGCRDTLELSYKHLPEALKSCLLYFGAFVKDKTIRAKRLMLMWAAEGFIPKRNNSFHNMAKQYLNDLVDRSLVIVHSRSSTGGIKHCSVHDLIRDLCKTKSQEEQFFRIIRISYGSRSLSREVYEQYRLCIHAEWESFVKAKARGPIGHTLLYFPISDRTVYYCEHFPYRNFKLLQLLDLQEIKIDDSGIPKEVTTLVNLRYLALAIERLIKVPTTIANLWNLETFILQRNHLRKILLPGTIWKMKRPRHVDVGNNASVHLDNDVGRDSSKLPNVESFSCVTIAHGKDGEELLRRLPSVRKLSCCFRNCPEHGQCVENKVSFIISTVCLLLIIRELNRCTYAAAKSCVIFIFSILSCISIQCDQLPKLDRFTMLESLNIVSEGVGYPCVFSFPATLTKLSLSNFFLPWSEFPTTIARLPFLEVLKLMSNAFEGHIWDVEEVEFPSLKYLVLHDLDVADWIASAESFPCLERLSVNYCHNLVEIPACFGEVPTMKSIEVYISNHGAEESLIEIQKGQLEIGNESFKVRVT